MTRPLLRNHTLFHSRDLDEARERVAAVFCPHRLETLGARSLFDACHHHLPGERLSLNYIEYGARTLIAPGELGNFYLLQIPLDGGAEISNGSTTYLSTPDRAAILNPHLPTRMTWEEGTRQVLVQISRRAMQDHLAAQLGGPSDRPLTFDGPLDIATGPGAALRRLVMWLVAETDAGQPPIGPGLMARQIEGTLLSGCWRHSTTIRRSLPAAAPRRVPATCGWPKASSRRIWISRSRWRTWRRSRASRRAGCSWPFANTGAPRPWASGARRGWPGSMPTCLPPHPEPASPRSRCAGASPISGALPRSIGRAMVFRRATP
ncbi:MAG: hypothetical protein C0426_00915 [Rhodobacter sp.]|nr:hypothetical protein [Rhodobacter sp.]